MSHRCLLSFIFSFFDFIFFGSDPSKKKKKGEKKVVKVQRLKTPNGCKLANTVGKMSPQKWILVQILGGQTQITSRYLPSYLMGMENGLIYATATTLRSFLNWTKKSVIKSTNGVQSKDSVDCRSPYLLFHALQDEHPRAGRETSSLFFF